MSDEPGKQQLFDDKKRQTEAKYVISDEEQISPDTTRKSISTERSFHADEGSSDRELAVITRESTRSFNLSTLSFDSEIEGHMKILPNSNPNDILISKPEDPKVNEEEIKLVSMSQLTENHFPDLHSHSFFHQECESTENSSSIKEAIDAHKQPTYPLSNAEYSSPSSQDALHNEKIVSNASRKMDKDYCLDNLHAPKVSSDARNITSERQRKYLTSLFNVRDSAKTYLSVNSNDPRRPTSSSCCCSGIRKRTLQYWCHSMTMFSLLYVIISSLYVVATTIGLITYKYTYVNDSILNKNSAYISNKIISRTISIKPEILLNLNASDFCINGTQIETNFVEDSCERDFKFYIDVWNDCTIEDQKKYKHECKCYKYEEHQKRKQEREDEIASCLKDRDTKTITNINILSEIVGHIEKYHSSNISTVDIHDTRNYITNQRETLYKVRKIVQLVALLILATSLGLCIITWLFKKCLDSCCSRGLKCFEVCCSKVIVDDDDLNDDQALIDRAISARRNNRVHCNTTIRKTQKPSFQINEKMQALQNASKAKLAASRKTVIERDEFNAKKKVQYGVVMP